MSFHVVCNPSASKEFLFKSKYEVALVDFFFQRDCGYISVYFDNISLFRVNINQNDSIDSINTILQQRSSRYKELTVLPSVKYVSNNIIFDSGNGKFKLSDEARRYFNIENVYISKKSFEWKPNTIFSICCDIVSEQLVGQEHFQILEIIHSNKKSISFPQYVDVQRTNFNNINISILDEKFNKIKTESSIFRLHFRQK